MEHVSCKMRAVIRIRGQKVSLSRNSTYTGRRFNMPDFVWTVDGDSSESASYGTGNCFMASV
ncbi:hypothetical protein H5410_029591 [Solanum commersonii]|uniref:Uncharacterized protein n=1 Tax=Solanum commersonii TaxID=4109 RepID=A0A9J5YDN8_SOLCO|nr:hypothetical protein H5410_029591 [Solanum commersonii]